MLQTINGIDFVLLVIAVVFFTLWRIERSPMPPVLEPRRRVRQQTAFTGSGQSMEVLVPVSKNLCLADHGGTKEECLLNGGHVGPHSSLNEMWH